MLDLKTTQVLTSGAYVSVKGLYPFQIGWKPHNGSYPVVRLGGHIEANETGWQCALREVKEESGMRVRSVQTGKTYLVRAEDPNLIPMEINWDHPFHCDRSPFLVVAYDLEKDPRLSLMYLAQSDEIPVPSAEVKGILMLTPESIHRICQERVTLEEYLNQGGQAVFNAAFDLGRVLEPFIQLRILSRLLEANKA